MDYRNWKGANPKVNQDLWCRFLVKKGYSGIYYKFGTKFTLLHNPFGILSLIRVTK